MKKTFALILVLILAVILCASCGQKKEEKNETTEGLVTYTIYNRTGETVEKLTLKDNNSKNELTVTGISDGSKNEASLTAVLENGAPSLQLSFETKTAQYAMPVMQKDVPLTLLPIAGEGEHVVFTEPKD